MLWLVWTSQEHFIEDSKFSHLKSLWKHKKKKKNDLLRSLQTENAIVSKVIDFVIHIIYNRPNCERTPGHSRYALLFIKRGNKKVFASSKTLIPDVDSLTMKIKRANLVVHSWINCLNLDYEGLDPLLYGWYFDNDALSSIWYNGPALPTMNEIADRQSVTFSEEADETNDNESSDDDYYTDDDLCAHSEAEILSNNECSDDEY